MIWLIGNKGMLGREVEAFLKKKELAYIASDQEIDITNLGELRIFSADKPISWVINCAAYTAVDKAEDETDLAFCGGTVDEARNNLKTAVRLFLEEAEKMGTLEEILIESGYEKAGFGEWLTPRLIATELMSVHG